MYPCCVFWVSGISKILPTVPSWFFYRAWFFKKGFRASSDHCTILLRGIPKCGQGFPMLTGWVTDTADTQDVNEATEVYVQSLRSRWVESWLVDRGRTGVVFFLPNATPRIHWDERYIYRPRYMKSSNINLNVGKYITYHIHGSCEKHHDVQFWNDGLVSTCLLLVMLKRDGAGNHTFAGLFGTLAFWVILSRTLGKMVHGGGPLIINRPPCTHYILGIYRVYSL